MKIDNKPVMFPTAINQSRNGVVSPLDVDQKYCLAILCPTEVRYWISREASIPEVPESGPITIGLGSPRSSWSNNTLNSSRSALSKY